MAKSSVLSRVLDLLTLGSLARGSRHTYSQRVPTPKGLGSCAPSDPLAVRVTRAAAKSGGELVGCFKSEKKIWLRDVTSLPFEVATAFDLPGSYAWADLEKLLATGIEQWKGYEQLSEESENYTVRLNELIRGAGPGPFFKPSFFKPMLVSIGRIGAKSFSVVSIRSYVFDTKNLIWLNAVKLPVMNFGQVIVRKVNGSADVLRGSRLVRLNMQRVLTDPSDVAQVQSEIAEWANLRKLSPLQRSDYLQLVNGDPRWLNAVNPKARIRWGKLICEELSEHFDLGSTRGCCEACWLPTA